MINNMTPIKKRYAISMWDFSWLTRREGSENEYADFDKVLDELVERGYNCVRIDAFPHLIAAIDDTKGILDEFIINPEPYSAQWGNKVPVVVNPKKKLIEFIKKAKERNVGIALSSWFNPDSRNLRDALKTPDDFFKVWHKTLQMLVDEKLDDTIKFAALIHEDIVFYIIDKPFRQEPRYSFKKCRP